MSTRPGWAWTSVWAWRWWRVRLDGRPARLRCSRSTGPPSRSVPRRRCASCLPPQDECGLGRAPPLSPLGAPLTVLGRTHSPCRWRQVITSRNAGERPRRAAGVDAVGCRAKPRDWPCPARGSTRAVPSRKETGVSKDLSDSANRKKLKKSSFALPEEEKYPIPDIEHARNALARVAQHG